MEIFFDNWETVGRALVMSVLAYLTMIFLLRISGKRTLSKMNAFDFIVTIALGSALSSVALNKNVTLAEGVTVFIVLILMQYLFTWLSVRVKAVKKIITSQPAMLLYKGDIQQDVIKRERITMEEIYMAARQKGISDLKQVDIIVLETTGDITIISELSGSSSEITKDVKK